MDKSWQWARHSLWFAYLCTTEWENRVLNCVYSMVFCNSKTEAYRWTKGWNKSIKRSCTVTLRLRLILLPLLFGGFQLYCWQYFTLMTEIKHFERIKKEEHSSQARRVWAFALRGLDCHPFLLSNSSHLECECLSHHCILEEHDWPAVPGSQLGRNSECHPELT